jgi:hypothetical protein
MALVSLFIAALLPLDIGTLPIDIVATVWPEDNEAAA